MQTSPNNFSRIFAAFIFFTRLPFWRFHQPPKEAYATVVEHWPLTGWLTGGIMAATLFGLCHILPLPIAVILAVIVRLFVTGALHEDGLADFFDGFGGGTDRQRILTIMKDSHIGTYGVLALILYLALLFATLLSMQPTDAALTILMADPYAKMISAQVIQMMPYARTEETAKSHVVYRKFSWGAGVSLAVQGLLPVALYLWWMQERVDWQLVVFLPCLMMYFLYRFIWHRLRGYTGDCCGAIFLLTELTVYMIVSCSFSMSLLR